MKKVGRVEQLSKAASQIRLSGTVGIGHTRWATHGGVTEANAHPHVSSDGKFALIHNGVIENYSQIKAFLLSKGYTFKSETDTEVLCNLIAYHFAKEPKSVEGQSPFLESVRKALRHVEGTYGIAVLCVDYPGRDRGRAQGLAPHPRRGRQRVPPRERRLGARQPAPATSST